MESCPPSRGIRSHPSRQALFVGDFIDRGPRQVDTYRMVRAMVEAGTAQAVMGNHEFNAIAWATPDPNAQEPGRYLRPRHGSKGAKNQQQHKAFLQEVEGTALHQEIIDWFMTLPLWLDLPELRVVHACWHEKHIDTLRPMLANDRLTPDLLVRASRHGDEVFQAVECLTKGLELSLPEGHSFLDKDGHERREVRIRWWDEHSDRYQDLALMPSELRSKLPDVRIAPSIKPVYDRTKPVFFGHYWMQGTPVVQGIHFACVDYSAGKGGPLMAYRWCGEREVRFDRFVSTD